MVFEYSVKVPQLVTHKALVEGNPEKEGHLLDDILVERDQAKDQFTLGKFWHNATEFIKYIERSWLEMGVKL
jgi:hypothetical protein